MSLKRLTLRLSFGRLTLRHSLGGDTETETEPRPETETETEPREIETDRGQDTLILTGRQRMRD